MLEYKGRVERIIFENEGFFIFTFRTRTQELKAKGTFIGTQIRVHQDLVLKGEWKKSKWGQDFNVSSFEEVEPSDVEGITRYLTANVKGVGWITAKKIADHFGEQTVEILTGDPRRIYECTFLSDTQKLLTYETLTRNMEYRDISVFLMSFDVSNTMVKRIYEKWGNKAREVLTDDPYQLTKIRGISFRKADEIAVRMGIDPHAPVRVKAVIRYILSDVISKQGHLFQTRPRLHEAALELLGGCDAKLYEDCLQDTMVDGDVQIDGERIYAQQHYYTETHCAYLLTEMMSPVNHEFDLEAFVGRYEAAHSEPGKPFKLSDEQFQALELALISKVLVITGGPGTGKTTILKAIVSMFETIMKGCALMTPTGISSKRLKQVTGKPAGTIHRTLGCKGDGVWGHNEHNPLPAEAIIVDEASMIDQGLFYRLLIGIRRDATLILVGDSAQLPSVGPGNVLREVIRSGCVSTVQLTTIHRQEEASDIVLNAHRINNGQELVLDTRNPKSDFKYLQIADEDLILDRIVYVAKILADRGVTFQVLSPRHKGTVGVESLNNMLREALNPDVGQPEASFKLKKFRVGDRVMVTRNRYNHGVFNGDIGNITRIDKKDRSIQFLVDGATVPTVFDYSDVQADLVLAYCVTVHKSQGSEWHTVLMPMVTGFSIQLQRNLFYTAVTRARRKVLVFGHWRAINKAIRNDKVRRRNTIFGTRIKRLSGLN